MDIERIQKLAAEQAEDETLFFYPERITESILQRALRELHAVIEDELGEFNLATEENTMKNYRKKGVQAMRPYVDGEDMSAISIAADDQKLPTLLGGMIAINANNPTDQWYVAKVFFEENYIEAE